MTPTYEARAVRPLPKRVVGPIQEYPIGTYASVSQACHAVSWWYAVRGGLHNFRGVAYVREVRDA